MYKKIVLAGGNGYLGQVLTDYYKKKAGEIVILSRKQHPDAGNVRYKVWDGIHTGDWAADLESCDLLINLCGKNVNCRYTPKNQKAILDSRIIPTALLASVVQKLQNPPRVWINLASATIYRHAEDSPQDEASGDIGTGFSVDVCKAWEQTFSNAHTPRTKKIILRTGIVFGRRDGVFPLLKNLALSGLGGHQGHGRQMVSWIHEHDIARITEWVFDHAPDGSFYNCTVPEAISNREMMRIIRKNVGVPFGVPTPQCLLEIGARIIGTETELVLKSRWAYPGNLIAGGFRFQFTKFEAAIHDIMSDRI